MNSEIENPETNTESKALGYCRVCGKALHEMDARTVQGILYCQDHLPAGTPPPPPRSGTVPPPSSPYAAPAPGASTSPGLAFALGLIPGVGAIYNSQYAKGLIHVIIFGLLITIIEQGAGGFEPLFALLLSAFVFYMAFEAYHTARRRQLGEPVDEFSSLIPLKGQAGSKAGPIVLIVGGVAFLLLTLDVIEIYVLVKYWPVLLIALGAYMLYARASAERRDDGGAR